MSCADIDPRMTADRVVLLSVREEWVRAILDGQKTYEYRKRPPARDPPYRLLLYATGGPSEVWGEAVVDRVVTGDLDTVLARTVGETPHAPAAVRAYFEGSTATTTATALHLTDVTEYETPVTREQLSAVVPGFTSPQNFRYLSPAECEQLRQSGR
jgi:predicted transcriptional regulator